MTLTVGALASLADLDNGSVTNIAMVTAECEFIVGGPGAICAEEDDGETIERDLALRQMWSGR